MKVKYLLIGLFALVLAVGSAFASISTLDETAKLRVEFSDSSIECIDVGSCDMAGENPCQVTVQNLGSSQYDVRNAQCLYSNLSDSDQTIAEVPNPNAGKTIVSVVTTP